MRLPEAILITLLSAINPITEKPEAIEINNVSITAYCYGTRTASGQRVREGHIALSRGIVKAHKVKFGDTVVVHGIGTYDFQDLMPPQWTHPKCDIYIKDKRAATIFGLKRNLKITIIKRKRITTCEKLVKK